MNCFDRCTKRNREIKEKKLEKTLENKLEKKLKDVDIVAYTILKGIDQECVICLNLMEKNDRISLIYCGHFYHEVCLDYWFKTKRTCPLCDITVVNEINETNVTNVINETNVINLI